MSSSELREPIKRTLQFDDVCDRFEQACRQGQARIEEYLTDAADLDRTELLRELIGLEIYYRRQSGENLQRDEYHQRFPSLGMDWLNDVLSPRDDGPTLGETRVRGSATGSPPSSGEEYELAEELGRGGMGVVYRATQTRLNRIVALKMVLAEMHGETHAARLRAEAEAAARLNHPHIVQVFDISDRDNRLCLAMEFLPGGTLAQRLRSGPLPVGEAARLVEQIARGVHHAHLQGVIHRDLKPANVLLTPEGLPKVADFGLAKQCDAGVGNTQSGDIVGTPAYMAPEQASGRSKQVGPAADVYSLGAVLYELLTGKPPFQGATPLDTLLQVLNDEPLPPSRLNTRVPRDLENICLGCLRKEARLRYPTAEALADDLERYLDGKPVVARPVGVTGRLLRWTRRRPGIALLLASLLLSLVGGAVFTWSFALDALREKTKAETNAANEKAARLEVERALRNADVARLALQLDAVQRETAAGNLYRAAELLEEAPTSVRGDWEYRYLHAMMGSRLVALRGHGRSVSDVVTSPDGRLLASAGADGDVRLWEWQSGSPGRVFQAGPGNAAAIAFSPDGKRLAVGGRDGLLRVWALEGDQSVRTLRGHESWVTSVAFSPDGRWIASGSNDRTIRLWDASGSEAAPPVHVLSGHEGSIAALAFRPDSRVVASGGWDNTVRLWELAIEPGTSVPAARVLRGHGRPKGKITLTPELGNVHAVAFSPTGNLLASAGSDGTVRLWDGTTGMEKPVLEAHATRARALAFTADGTRLATCAWHIAEPGEVKVWDVQTRKLLPWTTLRGEVHGLAWNADGNRLALARRDGAVWVWRPGPVSGPTVVPLPPVRQLPTAYSGDGSRLAVRARDDTVRVLELPAGREVGRVRTSNNRPLLLALDEKGSRLAFAGQEGVEIWPVTDAAEGDAPSIPLPESRNARALAFTQGSNGTQLVAVGFQDRRVAVWQLPEGRSADAVVAVPLLSPQDGVMWKLAGSRCGRWFAGVHPPSPLVECWDAETGKSIGELGGPEPMGNALAFAPDGATLAGACADRTVRLWDIPSGRELCRLRGHGESIQALTFSPDGTKLVSVAGDPLGRVEPLVRKIGTMAKEPPGEIRFWDVRTKQATLALSEASGALRDVTFVGPDGRWLALTCRDDTVRLLEAPGDGGR